MVTSYFLYKAYVQQAANHCQSGMIGQVQHSSWHILALVRQKLRRSYWTFYPFFSRTKKTTLARMRRREGKMYEMYLNCGHL